MKKELGKNQREPVLREQMRAIKKELGGATATATSSRALKERLDKAGLPEDARRSWTAS